MDSHPPDIGGSPAGRRPNTPGSPAARVETSAHRFHLETDASLNPHQRKLVGGVSLRRAGGGFVLRSPAMKVVGKYTVSLGFLSSPTLAEAATLLRGMRVARQRHGVRVLRARTDCFPLVGLVRDGGRAHDPALRAVVENIVEERDQFESFEIRWSPSSHAREREYGVPTADALARKAAGLGVRGPLMGVRGGLNREPSGASRGNPVSGSWSECPEDITGVP